MSGVDVSVVVVNWNTRDDLRRCLRSVLDETKDVTIEVFVVDNASADGSADMVRAEFRTVTLIANETNRGFAAANNQGLALATGRYALLLNPDTLVKDGAIGRTVRIADSDPRIGVLGCQVLLREDEIQKTCFRFSTAFDELLINTGLDRLVPASWFDGGPGMRTWDRRSARDVEVVSGMYMLVRREAMDEVGVMDDAYFVYAEEADWCWRFKKAGWRCSFTPEARIVHHDGGGRSTSQIRARMYVQLQKSILIFHRKNQGWASFAFVKSVYVVTNAVRVALFGLQSVFAAQARAKVRCAWAALAYQISGAEPVR